MLIMGLVYKSKGRTFSLSIAELSADYSRFCELSDSEFIRLLPEIIHFGCIVSWWQGFGQDALSDTGIVHQLVHLLTISDEPLIDLSEIRGQFEREMRI